MLIGYGRVSTGDQSLALQLDALAAAGCEKVFQDVASGRDMNRHGLEEALEFLREGDTLVVWKLCRLGRSTVRLLETLQDLQERKVGFRSLKDPGWDTSTATGRMLFGMLAVLVEYEAALTRERTRAGLAAARARGRNGGRPAVLKAREVVQARKLLEQPDSSVAQVAQLFKVSARTLGRYLAATP